LSGGDNCVRLLPPLNLTIDEASEAMGKLERACERARAKAKAPTQAKTLA
jgi:acetylornithine/N-succinyldiaminopimelate aminotransferase